MPFNKDPLSLLLESMRHGAGSGDGVSPQKKPPKTAMDAPKVAPPSEEVDPQEIAKGEHEPGAFMSFLRWMDRPGQAVRNIMVGEPEGAVRQVADFFGELVDAFIPGDIIPAATRPQDYVEGSKVMGLGEDEHWALRLAADLGIGILTDPLTYLTMGLSTAATKGAKAALAGTRYAGMSPFKAARQLAKDTLLSATATRGAGTLVSSRGKTLQRVGNLMMRVTDKMSQPGLSQASKTRYADKLTRLQSFWDNTQNSIDAVVRHTNNMRPTIEESAKVAASMKSSIAKLGIPFTDVGFDLPLTYEQVGKVAGLVGEQAKKVVPRAVQEFGEKFTLSVRGGLGWFRHSDKFDDMLSKVAATGQITGDVERMWLQQTMRGVKVGSNMDLALGALMNKVMRDGDQLINLQNMPRPDAVARVASKFKVPAEQLSALGDEITRFSSVQWDNLTRAGVVSGPGIKDYFPRMFRNLADDALETASNFDGFSAIAKRRLDSAEDVIKFLRSSPGTQLEPSAIVALTERIGRQSRLAQKGEMVQQILGPGSGVVARDPAMREAMTSIVDSLLKQDPEMGRVLKYIQSGQGPRTWFADLLALNNKIFKPSATHGLLVPRMSFHVRNKLSSIWQAMSVPGSDPVRAMKTVPGDLYGAISDGMRAIGLGGAGRRGNFAPYLSTLDEAISRSGGSVGLMSDILKQKGKIGADLLDAVNNGVLSGFVKTENLLSSWARSESAAGGFAKNWLTMGGEMTQGLEGRMRLGLFLDLKGKVGVSKAAKIVRDTQLDYGLMRGDPNMYGNMRHLIPFLAFTSQSIPQQAKFMLDNPAIPVALAQLYSKPSGKPMIPWIAEQSHIPLGKDREGNDQYLTTLGLPFEALSSIPNLSAGPRVIGQQIRRGVMGQAHPVIKAGYGYLTGEDPFFGSKYGSYDRTPHLLQAMGAAPRSEASRIYREMAGLGIAQPIVSAEQVISRFFDPRTTPIQKMLTSLTGMRVASNDPDRAALALLEDRLSRMTDVRNMSIPFAGEGADPITESLLEARRRAAARVRGK